MVLGRDLGFVVLLDVVSVVKVLCVFVGICGYMCVFVRICAYLCVYVGLMLVMGAGVVPDCGGAMLGASLVVCAESCPWCVV